MRLCRGSETNARDIKTLAREDVVAILHNGEGVKAVIANRYRGDRVMADNAAMVPFWQRHIDGGFADHRFCGREYRNFRTAS